MAITHRLEEGGTVETSVPPDASHVAGDGIALEDQACSTNSETRKSALDEIHPHTSYNGLCLTLGRLEHGQAASRRQGARVLRVHLLPCDLHAVVEAGHQDLEGAEVALVRVQRLNTASRIQQVSARA